MSAGRPPLTTHRRLAPGTVLRQGASAPYRAVEIIAGEPHVRRDDLCAQPARLTSPPGARPLLCLIHVTDLQLADVQSPTRFEFLNRYFADPRYAGLVPVQRPQEALTPHAVDATLRTVNALRGPATGQPPALAVTTGDAIDNAQWNEVQAFLALFDGGQVTPDSGGPGYAGVQAPDWPDDIFWKPDGDGPDGPDFFRRELGFPHHPGLLEAAMREFTAGGLAMPWLSCFGNHEALNQGVGTQTPGLAAALTGGRKPVALPAGFDSDVALELFTVRPEAFMAGPSRAVPADPGRRPVTRREFVAAHFRPGARPLGHGFTDENRRDGTAYYVHDTPAARFIALDTNCLAGGADGCLDRQQARWLADRLAEVHSAYRGPAGDEIRTGRDDRLVILFSHHGADTLTNTRGWHPGPEGEPLIGAAELVALLHRFLMPWLSCFGNHEALNQGVGMQTPGLAAALTGGWKPVALPGGFDSDTALELFTVRPEAFMAGPSRAVPPDPGRRPVTRREFVAAHFRPGARPLGHGFTDENLRHGTAYYVHDTPAARFIALDTNCLAGGADGCLDRQQARWLEDRLAEVHSAYRGPAGDEVATGQDDRLVILFSHHGVDTLTNTRGWHPGPEGEPLIGAAELVALLHRFPNVVLWLNGHTHTNEVRPRRDPDHPGRGFWEVTTCAVVDWPCQTRLVELADSGGQLSITCTMVDHDTPLGPPAGPGVLATAAQFSPGDLAALHRELAANIPFGGEHPGRTGAVTDRNVELLISPPFPLGRLPGI